MFAIYNKNLEIIDKCNTCSNTVAQASQAAEAILAGRAFVEEERSLHLVLLRYFKILLMFATFLSRSLTCLTPRNTNVLLEHV